MNTRIIVIPVCALMLTSAGANPAHRAPMSSVEIDVTGGPRAGHHTLAAADLPCIISQRSKNFSVTIGMAETEPASKDPAALTLVVLNIRNAGKAAVTGDDYEVSISFGPVLDTDIGTYYMSGFNQTSGRRGGTGSVRLSDDGGRSAKASFDVEPAPGIKVTGTVTCMDPLRY